MSSITIVVTHPSQIPAAVHSVVEDVHTQLLDMRFENELTDMIPDLQQEHSIRFRAGMDDTGAPWAPLAPRTARKKGHGVILVEFGDLEATLTQNTAASVIDVEREPDGTTLTFGTRDEHSETLQDGNPDNNLPARPHVGVMENTVDRFAEQLADSIVNRLIRG